MRLRAIEAFRHPKPTPSSQSKVFSEAEPTVLAVLDGFNSTIFAYGQTGTGDQTPKTVLTLLLLGKSHTIRVRVRIRASVRARDPDSLVLQVRPTQCWGGH